MANREAMKQLAVWVAFAAFAACGGKYQDPGSGTGGGASEPSSAGASGGAEKSSPSSSSPLPSHELGTCKPGFDRAANPTRACHWLSDAGTCFDSKDDACACICPTDHDSFCWSPFDDGPSSATPVHCN